MVKPMDDLPDDLLDMTSRAGNEFGFNKKQERALEFIKANIPISGVADILTEDLWLREVLKDVDSESPTVRSKALEMIGRYIGALGTRGAKPGRRKVVEFEE